MVSNGMTRGRTAYDGEAKIGIQSRITSTEKGARDFEFDDRPCETPESHVSWWFEDVLRPLWFNIPNPESRRTRSRDGTHGRIREKTEEPRKVTGYPRRTYLNCSRIPDTGTEGAGDGSSLSTR